ncbi:MAG: hypothetical protein HYY68_02140 [Thaumarchaeota archaeon]|nr:hypothetical protein [Nitrososphaerota archaeon]
MGVITLKLDDEIERKLRKRAAELKGAARGTLSESVEEAIMLWLEQRNITERKDRLYRASIGERKVAEAESLDELSSLLRKARVDPRDVIIQELPTASQEVRLGFRTTSIEG